MISVPVFTPQQLEVVAEKYIESHCQYGCYDNRMFRIEHVVEKHGYQIWAIPGLSEIAVALVPYVEGLILIDEELYLSGSPRCRFTLAEELSHILIHRSMFTGLTPEEVRAAQDSITDEEYARIEHDAKHLAGAFLMPKEMFTARYNHYVAVQSMRTSNDLIIIGYAVKQLGLDFCVSKHAAAVRALKLGLIDQEELNDLGFV